MLTLDVRTLLVPISEELPAGEYLRYEDIYDQIQQARREDDQGLPQGIWQTELKRADWNLVEQIALDALATRSKDLQIAAWLLEAWMNLYGFSGLSRGLHLVNSLCTTFWNDLHPPIEGDDIEFRVAPIHWINEKLSIRVKQIPITDPQGSDARRYGWIDWEEIMQQENESRKASSKSRNGNPDQLTRAAFDESMMMTPKQSVAKLRAEIIDSLVSCRSLESFLDERCGRNAPSLKQFRDRLDRILLLLPGVDDPGGDRPQVEPVDSYTHETKEAPGDMVNNERSDGIEESADRLTAIEIGSRAEAYDLLQVVADYLVRTEPHSPTPYLVKRAILWGRMPLAELLEELVEIGQNLPGIYRLLGINQSE